MPLTATASSCSGEWSGITPYMRTRDSALRQNNRTTHSTVPNVSPFFLCPAGQQLNFVALNVRNRTHGYIGSCKRYGACSQKAHCTPGEYRSSNAPIAFVTSTAAIIPCAPPSNCAACSGSVSRVHLLPTPVETAGAVGLPSASQTARPSSLHSPQTGDGKLFPADSSAISKSTLTLISTVFGHARTFSKSKVPKSLARAGSGCKHLVFAYSENAPGTFRPLL